MRRKHKKNRNGKLKYKHRRRDSMLNGVGHNGNGNVKRHLTNDPVEEYWFVFRPGAMETIKQGKGWQNDNEMAQGLGVTRQLISQIKHGKAKVTDVLMLRIALAMGNIGKDGNWGAHLYEPKRIGSHGKDHPKENYPKYRGEVPYAKYSPSVAMRRQDNENLESR